MARPPPPPKETPRKPAGLFDTGFEYQTTVGTPSKTDQRHNTALARRRRHRAAWGDVQTEHGLKYRGDDFRYVGGTFGWG
jgi:hypothetical protein